MAARSIAVTIVTDNRADNGLLAEHGFSLLVEVAGRQLLFDTGQGPSLRHNTESLALPLHRTEFLVLSHGHYDHTGGVPILLERAPDVSVYCHPAVTRRRNSVRNGSPKSIGMPVEATQALSRLGTSRIRFTLEPTQLFPGVGVTGPILRQEDDEVSGPFFLDDKGHRPDPIEDDMALWIRTPKGLVVCCGCCHAGLENTLRQTQRAAEVPAICAVIGGLHLAEATGQRIDRVISALAALDVQCIVPCHCTGDRAIERLKKAFGHRVLPGRAGLRFAPGGPEALRYPYPIPQQEL
jgi:7,8-dihydropterin-6-yl-methyl-4-(beta-D-ribofuranosyl)aminobenzene 5'-phosphate synthase